MKTVKPYLLIAPALVLLCVFCIYPIFNMIGLSLYEWDMISPFKKFVGLQNFVKLAADKQFFQTLLNTVIYVACTVGFGVGFGLILAVFRRVVDFPQPLGPTITVKLPSGIRRFKLSITQLFFP